MPTIRLAQLTDLPAVVACVRAAYEGYTSRLGKPPAPLLADYGPFIAEGVLFVLPEQGDLAGLIVLRREGNLTHIGNVAVHPKWQGQGFGRQLLDFAEAHARDADCHTLALFTNARMTENLAIYRKRGYYETERRTEGGYDRVFMQKTL